MDAKDKEIFRLNNEIFELKSEKMKAIRNRETHQHWNNILDLANKQFKRKIAPLTHDNIHYRYKILRDGVIEGHWHEDGNTYEITCPPQLQECLLTLLNNLDSIKVCQISNLREF